MPVNISMEKLQKKHPVAPSKYLWKIIAVCILSLILLVVGLRQLGKYNDRARYNKAEKEESTIAEQLSKSLEAKVDSKEQRNVCFNTEQGPYDNGKLWCQIATVIKLHADVDFKEVGEQFLAIARSRQHNATSSQNSGVPRYWFDMNEKMSCGLSLITSSGEKYGSSTRKVLSRSDAPAIAISCSDRARARHFPYVEG